MLPTAEAIARRSRPRTATETGGIEQRPAISRGRRPKLAIAVGLGWGVRNYLLSDTFAVLRRHFDLLVLSPFADLADFRRQFERDGVQVHGLHEKPQPFWTKKLYKHVEFAHYFRANTASHRMKLESAARFLRYRLACIALRWCGPWLFPLLRVSYCRLALSRWQMVGELRRLFRQEKVDALFSTNCCELSEWAAVLAARAEGLPAVTALTSWDNPSTKHFLVCDYDGYLVWNAEMRRHLQEYMEVRDAERIHLTGAPQFDYYAKPEYHQTRGEFCRQHGLDPRRKIVAYSTVTPGIMPDEPELVRQVHDLLSQDLPGEPQLLVRLHPKDRLERYEGLRTDPRRADVVWTLAGQPRLARRDQWCPSRDDVVRAVNTVRHADVNLHCRYSTIMLDFAALDKPVVVVAYDGHGCTAKARSYEQFEHLKPVVQSGAIQIAYTPEETEQYLRQALVAPEIGREARARLVRYELGELDGRAGERAGQAVIAAVTRVLRSQR